MASSTKSPPDAIGPNIVVITDDADVTLRVIKYTQRLKPGDDGNDKVKSITDFNVNTQVMIRNSEFFKTLLTGNFAEASQSVVTLKEHDPSAMQAIFCALHSQYEDWSASSCGLSITKQTLGLSVHSLCDVISSARHFLIEMVELDSWFKLWYEHGDNSKTDPKSMLYPTYQLNHAEGFAAATKKMVYHHTRIEETKNQQHRDLHLPPRVIQQLCAARGRLKTILSNQIWNHISGLLDGSCNCKEKTLFAFLHALKETGGFPVDQAAQRNPIAYVLHQLADFDDYFEAPAEAKGCSRCSTDWSSAMKTACAVVWKYFDGLCLDCMDHTQPKFADEHEDYWCHLERDMEWDNACRIDHGQATWYYSFMGRADARDKILKRVRLANPRTKFL
ncbi:hypothetical protein D6C97_05737 [Aureobasidium pullulans]|nr:hypothetical protein D6C97_05737 [Aureobasidium pullulans]